jgi:hypothetical protein
MVGIKLYVKFPCGLEKRTELIGWFIKGFAKQFAEEYKVCPIHKEKCERYKKQTGDEIK